MNRYDVIKRNNIIPIPQGATFAAPVQVWSADPAFPEDRSKDLPFNLTDHLVRAHLLKLDGTLAATFDTTIPVPSAGIIELGLTAPVTSGLDGAEYVQHVWGIEITSPSGAVLPEIQGGALVGTEVVI